MSDTTVLKSKKPSWLKVKLPSAEDYKKVRNFPFNDIQKMNGWLHGTNHDYLKKISKYWISRFNWKLQEKKIKFCFEAFLNWALIRNKFKKLIKP